jgi:hypothetical protein
MNDTRVDEQDKRRSSRAWLWILALCILIFAFAFAVFNANGGAQDTPQPTTDSRPSESPTPSTTPIPTAPPTAPAKDLGQGTFNSTMPGYLSDTLNSQNTAVLVQGGTFADPVSVFIAGTPDAQALTPLDATKSMESMFTQLDPNPWDFALSDAVLASYRAGPYGDYFPVGALVAKSHDGHVFSFIGHDSTITTMFMASSEDLLH